LLFLVQAHDFRLIQMNRLFIERWVGMPVGVIAAVAMLRGIGVDTTALSPVELLDLQPFVNVEDIGAAAYEPASGYASPADVVEGFRRRAQEIAGVLVNPVQAFHPNAPPPSDAILLTSGVRKTQDSTSQYAQWLRQLREVCSACDIPLIFDEVYTGFRLAPGGAQEYFGVQADMLMYGKTGAGGMPIGVVCGKKELMRRFDPERPMRIAYVIGTFSAHPVVDGDHERILTLGNAAGVNAAL
jgi:hypothetical protein